MTGKPTVRYYLFTNPWVVSGQKLRAAGFELAGFMAYGRGLLLPIELLAELRMELDENQAQPWIGRPASGFKELDEDPFSW